MSAPTVAEAEAINFETAFHLDKDVAAHDPENYLVIHELMGRGQLLNAYEVSPPLLTISSKHIILDPHARARIFAGRARAPARVSARSFSTAICARIVLTQLLFPSSTLPTPGEDGAPGTSSPASQSPTMSSRRPSRAASAISRALLARSRLLRPVSRTVVTRPSDRR